MDLKVLASQFQEVESNYIMACDDYVKSSKAITASLKPAEREAAIIKKNYHHKLVLKFKVELSQKRAQILQYTNKAERAVQRKLDACNPYPLPPKTPAVRQKFSIYNVSENKPTPPITPAVRQKLSINNVPEIKPTPTTTHDEFEDAWPEPDIAQLSKTAEPTAVASTSGHIESSNDVKKEEKKEESTI